MIRKETFSCIVSNFYIKSQLTKRLKAFLTCCIVSNFYIKSQHPNAYSRMDKCCIVSNFYIKSQPSPVT